jgi:hypothetical protein
MKSAVLNSYNRCGKDRAKFLMLVKESTGLTDAGIASSEGMQVYLDTLVFI